MRDALAVCDIACVNYKLTQNNSVVRNDYSIGNRGDHAVMLRVDPFVSAHLKMATTSLG